MSESDAYEAVDRTGDPGGNEPVLDPDQIAVTNHLDADEADLIEQFLEVPEDVDEAADR
jgi:hypothetical protein